MAKDKRSFFEKLTGAVHVDEETELEPAHPHHHTKSVTKKEDWADEETEGQLTVDVYQTPSDIIIKTMIAGVKADDLDISISRDMVTIKGKREESRDIQDEDYFFRELYWGSFSRTIVLPQEVEVEEAEALEKNGLLTIRLPKIDKNRQTKLKVRSNS